MSRIVVCHPVHPAPDVIDQIVAALEAFAAVVLPTETQYALSVRADHREAAATISRIKRRSGDVPAALFVQSMDMARRFCIVSDLAQRLADRFLPGPLTLVLPPRPGQDVVAAGFCSADGFGIRLSSSPIIAAVMRRVPFAVTATSANISGAAVPETVALIEKSLGSEVDLFVDGGPCRGIIPSTVVKVTDAVTILRQGVIPETEIRRCAEAGA